MQVNAATTNNTSTPTTGLGSGALDNTFLQLLTAQLKNQDPISPMDPNQFLGQLVQLNSLEQLISIRQLLSPPAPTTSTTPPNPTGGK